MTVATAERHVRFLSQNRPGPRMGMGHYERLLIEHVTGSAAGWRFDIVFDGRARGLRLEAGKIDPGLRGARFSGFSAGRVGRWPWRAAQTVARMGTGLSSPDLYHSLALSYPAPWGKPAVYTIHDLPPARFEDEGAVPRWARRAAQDARGIIVPSEFAKGELIELLDLKPERVHVIPYGCECDRFHAAAEAATAQTLAKIGIQGKFLLYAGGFTRRKNVRALLEAWKIVEKSYVEYSLALVGPAEPLRRIAVSVGAPRTVIAGYLTRDEMPQVMKAASGLICPSIYEGFGLPPLEAMASGVPVVAVRQTALPEVVGEGGLLVEDGSAEALARGISAIIEDQAGVRQRVRLGFQQAKRFCWEAHAKKVLEVYAAAVA